MSGSTIGGYVGKRHTLHFTDEVEYVSYIVKSGDKPIVGNTIREVAEQNVAYYAKQGYTDLHIEEKRATIRCGEVWY